MSNLAVSYAAIILADADVEITADKILALTNAANISDVEPIFAQLYAGAVNKADKKELLAAFGATGPAGGAGASASGEAAAADAGAADAAAAEEKKKQEAEEESDDMDMGMLF